MGVGAGTLKGRGGGAALGRPRVLPHWDSLAASALCRVATCAALVPRREMEHPNIVAYLGTRVIDGMVFIFTQLSAAGSLRVRHLRLCLRYLRLCKGRVRLAQLGRLCSHQRLRLAQLLC